MVQASDKELVEQCLQGNNRAYDIIVERYQLTMYRTAFSIVKNTELAKDVTQNGFIKSWEKLHSYNPEYKFYSWLYRIIVNEALNKTRTIKNYDSISSNHSGGENPVDHIIRNEENRRLYEAIEALPDGFSRVVYLRHFEDLSYKEIAEALDIEEKTVKSRLYSARMKLREHLFIDR